MKNKFEELIDLIVNEEEDKARELFHNLVVEKSREIYNDLVAEEAEEEEDEEEEMEESLVPEMGDATDDMMGDISADQMGMDAHDHDDDEEEHDDMMGGDEEHGEEGEEDLEDRVVDLEDALDELKAEFERLMGEEEGEEEHGGEEEGMPEGMVREYTENLGSYEKAGVGDEGTEVGKGGKYTPNTKSPVAGKNDMGGTAKNLVQGGEEKGGSAPKAGDMGAVDPRAAGKTAFAKKAPAAVTKDAAQGTHSPVAKA